MEDWVGEPGLIHHSSVPSSRSSSFRSALVAYAALAAASVLLTWFYVGAERCVYYWDFVNFQNRAFFLAELACARPLSAAAAVIRSLHHDYTYLPCVPLVPVLLAFGRSRMVFELALALVYLAPFCLVCAALTARITRRRGDALSWPAAAIALLTPAACVPVFRGYPDLGGAALVGMAFLLLFRDPAFRRQRSRYAIAALLALAALFRRHYAYSAAALAAVVLMGILAAAVSGLRTGRHAAIARALRRGQALAHLCLALAVFSSPLLVTALAGGYSRLYRSYQESAWATLGFFGSAFGWLPLALGAAGLLWTARRRGISGHHARLLALFGCAFLAFWALGGRFTGVHYATHLAAPAIVPAITEIKTTSTKRYLWARYAILIRIV